MGELGDYDFSEYGDGGSKGAEGPDYVGGRAERTYDPAEKNYENTGSETSYFGRDYAQELGQEVKIKGFETLGKAVAFLISITGKLGILKKVLGAQVAAGPDGTYQVSVYLCTGADVVALSKGIPASLSLTGGIGAPKSNGITATPNSVEAMVGKGVNGVFRADPQTTEIGMALGAPGLGFGPSVDHCIVIKVYDSDPSRPGWLPSF